MGLIVINVPLSYKFGIGGIYYFLVGISISLFLFFSIKKTVISKVSFVILMFAAYFLVQCLIEIPIHEIKLHYAISSCITILWPAIFFILYPFKISNSLLLKFLRWQVYIALIVATLGLIQFFISRDLFGFIPRVGLYDELYENKSITFRVSSILFSSQVYALFCVAYSIITIEKKDLFSKRYKYLIFIILFIAAIFSGSKSTIAIILAYFIIKIIVMRRYKILILSIIILSSVYILGSGIVKNQKNSSVIRTIGWLWNLEEFKSNEQMGRISIYTNLLKNSNLLLGNFVGSTNSANPKYINPESYLLKLYSEGGLILVILFLIFYFHSLIALHKINKEDFIFFMTLFISFIFVHAFASPAFFGLWGYLILTLKKINS